MSVEEVIEAVKELNPISIIREFSSLEEFKEIIENKSKYIKYEREQIYVLEILGEPETYIIEDVDEHLRPEQQNEDVFCKIRVDCVIIDDSLSTKNPYAFRCGRVLKLFMGKYLDLKTVDHVLDRDQLKVEKSNVLLEFPPQRSFMVDRFVPWAPMYSEDYKEYDKDNENEKQPIRKESINLSKTINLKALKTLIEKDIESKK